MKMKYTYEEVKKLISFLAKNSRPEVEEQLEKARNTSKESVSDLGFQIARFLRVQIMAECIDVSEQREAYMEQEEEFKDLFMSTMIGNKNGLLDEDNLKRINEELMKVATLLSKKEEEVRKKMVKLNKKIEKLKFILPEAKENGEEDEPGYGLSNKPNE